MKLSDLWPFFPHRKEPTCVFRDCDQPAVRYGACQRHLDEVLDESDDE